MNSQERRREGMELDRLHGPDFNSRMVLERESRDPEFAQLRPRYAEQAQAITRTLEDATLTPRKRQTLEWHLAVLNWRAEHGPKFHIGYYDFNFLPPELASANPQLKSPVLV